MNPVTLTQLNVDTKESDLMAPEIYVVRQSICTTSEADDKTSESLCCIGLQYAAAQVSVLVTD